MASAPPICCGSCGAAVELGEFARLAAATAQQRISELEAQAKILSDKATAAVDKLADYEDELQKLKRQQNNPQNQLLTTPPTTVAAQNPTNRISSFLSITSRRGAGPPSPPIDPDSRPPSSSGIVSTAELEKALSKEKALRKEAEDRLQQVTNELEDLSASLFQQANEMVAEERRARNKLEQRVAQLEQREKEKVTRLGQLEQAVGRINRVKVLLEDEVAAGGE